MSKQNTSPAIGFRLKVFFELLAGLRRHDFRSARTFMQMQSPGKAFPRRLGRFVGWALHQMWCEIPDTMQRVSFADPVSKVPCWLEEANPFENHPWRDQPDAVLPESADTVVIGCGLAGSAMAYFWGKKAPADRKLVVVEMHEAASGSAGRNEGLVVMGRYYHLVHTTVMRYLDAARLDLAPEQRDRMAHRFAAAYCRGCYRNGDLVEQTVREEGFDCDYVARDGCRRATPRLRRAWPNPCRWRSTRATPTGRASHRKRCAS